MPSKSKPKPSRYPVELIALPPRPTPICPNCEKSGECGMYLCFGVLDRRCASPLVTGQ